MHDKHDIELGTLQKEDIEYYILTSFLQRSNDVSDGIDTGEGEEGEKLKSQVAGSLFGWPRVLHQ